jgi:thiol-disulfide isomerase/thioredoxin
LIHKAFKDRYSYLIMKKNYIILIGVLIVIFASIVFLESGKVDPGINGSVVGERNINRDLQSGEFPEAPELAGISGYLNTEGEEIKISDYRGKVVLIDFWTYTCINCIRTLPFLTAWDEKYNDEGLVIIGVHTPEFEFEKKTENVQDAIDKYNIEYAVVQDNNFATWNAFENRYWPRKYLIDANGLIRYDHIGEGAYEETEQVIQDLLAEIGSDVTETELTPEDAEPRFGTTPELYAGYSFALGRGQNVGNSEGLVPDETVDYAFPGEISPDIIYLHGLWKSNSDGLELVGDTGSIALLFQASEVNIVADSENQGVMDVRINGGFVLPEQAGEDLEFSEERSFVIVDKPQLYNVIDGDHDLYLLELNVKKGFSFNAFTFG